MIIANIINTLLGLGMVYVAVLEPGLLRGQVWPMTVLAVTVFTLALVSRRRDPQTWQSSTTMVMAAGLFGLGLLQLHPYPYLTFWGLFWIGILVANLALWGAVQRPAAGESSWQTDP